MNKFLDRCSVKNSIDDTVLSFEFGYNSNISKFFITITYGDITYLEESMLKKISAAFNNLQSYIESVNNIFESLPKDNNTIDNAIKDIKNSIIRKFSSINSKVGYHFDV